MVNARQIDLDSSGLWCSSWNTVFSQWDKVYSHSTTSLKKTKRSLTNTGLVLFSSFSAIGAWLICWVHSHQVLEQSSSRLTCVIESYHRFNSLYDGTINCFSTLAQSSIALNWMKCSITKQAFVVCRLSMYRTNALLARLTKVRR